MFFDKYYVKEFVDWVMELINNENVMDVWWGFIYVLKVIYDLRVVLEVVISFNGYDDGNFYLNLLWWIYMCREFFFYLF